MNNVNNNNLNNFNSFGNDIGFDNDANSDNTYSGEGIEYLDDFYNQCLNYYNSDIRKKKNRKKVLLKSIPLVISAILSCIVFFKADNIAQFVFFLLCLFILLCLKGHFFPLDKSKYLPEGINYDCLQEYLKDTNQGNFAGYSPRCLTQKVDPSNEISETTYALMFLIVPVFLIAGSVFAFIKTFDSKKENAFIMAFFILVFASACIIIIIVLISRYLSIIRGQSETVYAVCVEQNKRVEERMERDSSGRPVTRTSVSYQPVFYATCSNGHKYLLYNDTYETMFIPNVGDIVKLTVSSQNPFKFYRKNVFFATLTWLIFTFMCLMGFYIMIIVLS